MDAFSLEGKAALVTGGSRGIGGASALALARAGADVAVTSRKLPDLEEAASEIRALGRKALAVDAHVGKMDQLQPLVDRVVAEFGKIDILVNCAGTNHMAPSIEMSEKSWDTVLNTNLKGLFFLSQAVARVMKENGGGSIVNISSTAGYRVTINLGHYSIAKCGAQMATKVMALEWAKYGIRANCIAPGATNTQMLTSVYAQMDEDEGKAARAALAASIPMKRIGESQELASAVLFLASDAASYVTGQTLVVDGGMLLT